MLMFSNKVMCIECKNIQVSTKNKLPEERIICDVIKLNLYGHRYVPNFLTSFVLA